MGARGFWTFFAVMALGAVVAVGSAARSEGARLAASSLTSWDAATTSAPATTWPTTSATTTTTTTTTTLPPTTTTTAFAPTDARLTIFGDSVILGAQVVLPGALEGWDVTMEAKVSRFTHQLVPVVEAAAPGLGQAAVVQIGHNYDGDEVAFAADLERVLVPLDDLGRVVLVTVAEVDDASLEVNAAVRAAAGRHPNVVLADWEGALAAQRAAGGPAYTARDGLHLTKAGADAMLALLSQALGPPPAAP